MIDLPRYTLDWSTGIVYGPQIDRQVVVLKRKLFQSFIDRMYSKYAVELKYKLWDLDPRRDQEDARLEISVIDEFFRSIVPVLDDEERSQLQMYMSDKGLRLYSFMRWENRAIRVRYYQDVVMCDPNRFKYVEGSNQDGKSFLLCLESCDDFMQEHGKNHTVLLVSKSQHQNGINVRRIKQILGDSSLWYDKDGQDSMLVTTRKTSQGHVNTLVCAVAGASGLGFPANQVRLDEFEFWTEDEGRSLEWYWDQVFVPRTFATGGNVTGYCNPNGRNFVSEKLQKRTNKDGSFMVHTYNFNYLDNPDNDPELYYTLQKQIHPITFASTMAAKRVESEGSALTEADIQSCTDSKLDELSFRGLDRSENWWFLDLGFVYDQSVLAACYLTKNEKNEVIYNFPIYAYPQAHPHAQMWGLEQSDYPSIPQLVKQYGGEGSIFELDLTGKEGNEVTANQVGLRCTGVKMSGPWKAKWYDWFVTLVKLGRVRVQVIDNWLDGHNKNFEFQARSLKMTTKTPDGRNRPYPLYHHTSEKDHDDILDAVVGCLSLASQDFSDSPSYDMAMQAEYDPKTKDEVPPFEEFIKTVEVPKFMKIENLRAWYNKRYGLN